jgi:hypothetical protein
VPTNQDYEKDITDLNDRVSSLEHKAARAAEAFVKNDLNVPDYDGHRKAHLDSMEQAKVVAGYKRTMTQRLLEWGLAGVGVLLGAGALDWIKGHLK